MDLKIHEGLSKEQKQQKQPAEVFYEKIIEVFYEKKLQLQTLDHSACKFRTRS